MIHRSNCFYVLSHPFHIRSQAQFDSRQCTHHFKLLVPNHSNYCWEPVHFHMTKHNCNLQKAQGKWCRNSHLHIYNIDSCMGHIRYFRLHKIHLGRKYRLCLNWHKLSSYSNTLNMCQKLKIAKNCIPYNCLRFLHIQRTEKSRVRSYYLPRNTKGSMLCSLYYRHILSN